jgi:hypothetical protein
LISGLARQRAELGRDGSVSRRRGAESAGVDGRERRHRPSSAPRHVVCRGAGGQPCGEGAGRLIARDDEPDVRHENLRVDEIADEFVGVSPRDLRVDERAARSAAVAPPAARDSVAESASDDSTATR